MHWEVLPAQWLISNTPSRTPTAAGLRHELLFSFFSLNTNMTGILLPVHAHVLMTGRRVAPGPGVIRSVMSFAFPPNHPAGTCTVSG